MYSSFSMKSSLLLRLLIFLFIITNFIFISYIYVRYTGQVIYERERVNISRAIDGDTLVLEDGRKIRLLGINTPEKNQLYYEQAKLFLQKLEGEEAEIEALEKDKYGRTLAYLFYEDMINELLLEKGLAHLYYYDEDKYTNKLRKAEQKARKRELGIWKKSENFGCVNLIELIYEGDEKLVLDNTCEGMEITLKDDATHIYNIQLASGRFEKNFTHIWNNDGDTVYIWDDEGLLLFHRY